MDNEKTPKNAKIFECKSCYFKCCKKSEWSRHILTQKHKNCENDNNDNKKTPKNAKHVCECGKIYNYTSGLSRHKSKKNCSNNYNKLEIIAEPINQIEPNQLEVLTKLISVMVEQNGDLQKQIIDICKNGNNNNNNNNNTINSNNSFNLNFFLNETCKGALNINEFIETIKLQLKDLESVGKLGYIEGISEIIIRGLKELDVTKRPIHCSDIKRETLYVKNADVWENDKEKEKMKYTIQHIAAKNFKQIPEWIKENPLAKDSESKKHLEYMRIINKLTGGMTQEEDEKNYNKIIKKVANEVIIDK